MPGVMTTASTVQCAHGGAVSTSSTARLQVAGNAALLRPGVQGMAVSAACTVQNTDKTKKCTSVTSVTTGEASKLRAGGQAVLLETLAGTTDGVPPGTVSGTAGHSKLTSV